MLINKPADIKAVEITPKEHYLNRRQFMLSAAAMALSSGPTLGGLELGPESGIAYGAEKLANVKKGNFSTDEKLNTLKEITSYNNFYELGPDKEDPAENAKYLITRPWSVAVEGEVKKAKTYDIEELIKLAPLEERIYRLR
ncbi:MAG: protein-methionine-sulfoxide reductase catalytic subunit MsrP, partial [Candidatus Binatia bacterium]